MSLHDRIMALPVFNQGAETVRRKSARFAKEADKLMADMAEALSVYADQDLGYGVAEEALKQYKTWEAER